MSAIPYPETSRANEPTSKSLGPPTAAAPFWKGPSPQGFTVSRGPRAAFSHSASVGNRFPIHRQYRSASDQLTSRIGCASRKLANHSSSVRPGSPDVIFAQTPAAMHFLYEATVTSIRSIRNASRNTRCAGLSSVSLPRAFVPIVNAPAGMATIDPPGSAPDAGAGPAAGAIAAAAVAASAIAAAAVAASAIAAAALAHAPRRVECDRGVAGSRLTS